MSCKATTLPHNNYSNSQNSTDNSSNTTTNKNKTTITTTRTGKVIVGHSVFGWWLKGIRVVVEVGVFDETASGTRGESVVAVLDQVICISVVGRGQ